MTSLPAQPDEAFPYQVEAKIGEGAMGLVYRALEPMLGRTVAIKVLRPTDPDGSHASDTRKRFLQEARAAAGLAHPGVTTIYRVGETQGQPYIAMEWLEGQTLEQLLAHGPLPAEEVAHLGVQLLETLDVAHRAGVVHRDIKPANLVLVAGGRLKVTDFGIARVQHSDLIKTQAGMVLATPRFASPEQLRSEDVDGRADLFATGILLYLSLSGKYPFAGNTFLEVANAILRAEPVPLRELVPQLHPTLEAVVHRALHKDRDDRYASALEMARELRPFLQPPGQSTARSGIALERTPPSALAGQQVPTLINLPAEDPRLVYEVVRSWTGRPLPRQDTAKLLALLQERPLHAPPFAGGVVIGSVCLLAEGGLLLGALDVAAPERDTDAVLEGLAGVNEAHLHPLPAGLPSGVVATLAALLRPPKLRHRDLDSSFVHLPALAEKLATEGFSGWICLRRGDGRGLLILDRGHIALHLFTRGWKDVDVERPWQSWVSEVSVRASVAETEVQPALASLRQQLAGLELEVQQQAAGEAAVVDPTIKTTRILQQVKLSATGSSGSRISFRLCPAGRLSPEENPAHQHYRRDPIYRFLDWALAELPSFFFERDKAQGWKYLVGWLFLIRRAFLHHALPQPDGARTDFFDLVTEDHEGKVLHLGHRLARATPESLREVLQRAIEAKSARRKTGDVGGAFILAPHFDADTLAAYAEATRPEKSGGWFSVEETLTGYEGFVRIGPRRGFHLLLIQETDEGFRPILPG